MSAAAGSKARTPTAVRRFPQNRSTPSSKSSSNGGSDAGCGAGAGEGGVGVGGGTDSSVRVVVRVRPQNKKELEGGHAFCVSFPSEDSIELNDAKKTYDRVFDPSATQKEVFDYVAKPLVAELFNGYNGTIFAYGQTSSGKTHTMEGPSIYDPELAGVIPRAVREIFLCVAEAPDSLEFVIKVSYIEIYMEKIRDLLDTYQTKVNLPVREDKKRGVYVAGATEEYVTSAEELITVMAAGAKNRVTAATGMNQGSSRSHSVFIISLQQRDVNDSSTKTGMLFLVDLAGSEMVKKTHATGKVLEEAKTINKSLSALGQVINALTDDKKPHVPYRDSKLTRVLQNSLGGNSKTCLIVNCSPSSYNEAETQSTLRFGSRAKRIQNKAVVNETRSVEELGALLAKAEATFEMQQTYIAALEKQLGAVKKNAGGAISPPPPPSPAGEASTEGGDGDVSSPDGGEAANAIRRLTGCNRALQAELEEEKAEVKRREQESNELRQVLQERDRQLREAADAQTQMEKTYAVRLEAAAAENADLYGEIEGAKAKMQEVTQARKFEQEERSLTIEQLTSENARMAEEIRELTDEAVQKACSRTPPFPGAASSPVDAPSAAGAGATLASSVDHTANSAEGGTAKTATAAPLELSGSSPPVPNDRRLTASGSSGGDGDGAGPEGKNANRTGSRQVPPEELHEAEEALEGREGGSVGAGAARTMGGTITADRAEAARAGIEEWDVEALARWGRAALLSLLILYVIACVFVLMIVLGAVCSVLWTVSMSLASALELNFFTRYFCFDRDGGDHCCRSPYHWGSCGIDEVVRDSQDHAIEAAAEESPLMLLFAALGERFPGDAADGRASHPDEADVVDEGFTFCDSDEGGNDCDVFGLTAEQPDIRDLLPARGVVIFDACLSVLDSLFTGPGGVVTRLSGVLSALYKALVACIFTVPYGVFARVVGVCAFSFSGGLREVWIGLQGVFFSVFSAFGRDVILNDHGMVLGIAVVYLLLLGCVRFGLAHIKGVRGAFVALSAKSISLRSSGLENAHESHADADGRSRTFLPERDASGNAEINNDHVNDGHTSCVCHHDRRNDRCACGGGRYLWERDRCDRQCNSEIRYENGIAWHVHGGAWVKPDCRRSTEGSAGATENVMELIRAREKEWKAWQLSVLREKAEWTEVRKAERSRRQELDDTLMQQGERLDKDLQRVEGRSKELEIAISEKAQSDTALAREMKTSANLQARLEQLVSVHRALLRRYGTLELENSECRKQMQLRRDRIMQLQRNIDVCNEMMDSMREKMKEQATELLSVREEVSQLELSRYQGQRQELRAPLHGERRAIRGGGADHQVHEVKTLRGGGGRRCPDETQPWGGVGLRVESTGGTPSPSASGTGRGGVNGERTPDKLPTPTLRNSLLGRLTGSRYI